MELWEYLQWNYGNTCNGIMGIPAMELWEYLQWNYGNTCNGIMGIPAMDLGGYRGDWRREQFDSAHRTAPSNGMSVWYRGGILFF